MRSKGKKVVDATVPLHVRVMRKDIAGARPRDPDHCALARALTRQANVVGARVGARVAFVDFAHKPDTSVRFVLPKEDRQKIKDFDAAGYFGPGTFTLRPPSPGRKLGARAGQPSGSEKRTGKAKTIHNGVYLRNVRAVDPPS